MAILLLLLTVGLFVGFSVIQQTLGFLLQDKLHLSGIETAQLIGAALMVSTLFTFVLQVTVMQRVKLQPMQSIRIGLCSLAPLFSVWVFLAVLAVVIINDH